jgi:hypothetical protein
VSQVHQQPLNSPLSSPVGRIVTYLALAVSVVLCLPLLLGMCALLTIGSGPMRTQVPVALHTPLLIAMFGGPLVAAALSGGVVIWQSRTPQPPTRQGEEPASSGNALKGLTGLVGLIIAGAIALLLLGLFAHFVAG